MKIARVVLAVPALALIAACGAASTSSSDAAPALDSSGSGAADQPPGELAELAELKRSAAQDSAGTAAFSSEAAPQTAGTPAEKPVKTASPAIISTGKVDLHSDDIDKARFELRKLLDTWGGSIADEESNADDNGRTENARLVLRVPAKSFDTAMDALPGLGSLVSRTRTSTDVTTKVIDTDTRVRGQKLSIARIQALLDQATTLNQVISIERQLSARQADLDSLERQQKYLADQTAQSTITLYLSRPDDAAPAEKDHKTFGSGLSNGWHHLGDATTATLNAIGTALPFALVLLVVGVPAGIVLRRRLVSVR